jgi:hypothetical protein
VTGKRLVSNGIHLILPTHESEAFSCRKTAKANARHCSHAIDRSESNLFGCPESRTSSVAGILANKDGRLKNIGHDQSEPHLRSKLVRSSDPKR